MKRLVLLAFIWGWSFLFIKVAVGGMTPSTVAFARIALGAAVLVAVCRARRLALPAVAADLRTWWHLAFTAIFGSVLPFTLLAWGEERITSALTAVTNASAPLFTAVAVAVALSERLRRTQIAGLALGLLGVAVAAGVGGRDLTNSSVTGSLASVAAAACYGVAWASMRRNLMHLRAEVAAAGQLVVGAVLLAPFAAVTTAVEGIDLAPHRLGAIVLLGTLGTGVAYVLNYQVVAELGPTGASLVTYLIPVVAIAVGAVVLDERIDARVVIGALLVVGGIALVRLTKLAPPPWWRSRSQTPPVATGRGHPSPP